ncbi:MAG: hypothetical protein AMJ88_11075 [Anaerolineae bacterium SM23_ 63]|nr:MAG: hypothetical protein AMJ88_11075 [Anaerolineae bacterium SM23_ 63]
MVANSKLKSFAWWRCLGNKHAPCEREDHGILRPFIREIHFGLRKLCLRPEAELPDSKHFAFEIIRY